MKASCRFRIGLHAELAQIECRHLGHREIRDLAKFHRGRLRHVARIGTLGAYMFVGVYIDEEFLWLVKRDICRFFGKRRRENDGISVGIRTAVETKLKIRSVIKCTNRLDSQADELPFTGRSVSACSLRLSKLSIRFRVQKCLSSPRHHGWNWEYGCLPRMPQHILFPTLCMQLQKRASLTSFCTQFTLVPRKV